MLTLLKENAGRDGRIREGDVIAAVNGWRCQGHHLDKVSHHFSGPEGESAPWRSTHAKCLLFLTLSVKQTCACVLRCKRVCVVLRIEVGIDVCLPSHHIIQLTFGICAGSTITLSIVRNGQVDLSLHSLPSLFRDVCLCLYGLVSM